MDVIEMLPLLLPLIFIELIMKLISMLDIIKPERNVKYSKVLWGILVLAMTGGWALYYLVGKED